MAENSPGLEFVGFVNDVKPSTTGAGLLNLSAGTYVYACFLPIGGKQDGAPHVTKGMYGELTVK